MIRALDEERRSLENEASRQVSKVQTDSAVSPRIDESALPYMPVHVSLNALLP